MCRLYTEFYEDRLNSFCVSLLTKIFFFYFFIFGSAVLLFYGSQLDGLVPFW